jgi:hypothetical protein
MSIAQKIRAYHGDLADDEHHRYRSWEHCYRYFRQTPSAVTSNQRDHAALHLGFYLSSWGMYRGSGFLLKHTYTVHLRVIDCLAEPRFGLLWQKELGADENDQAFVPTVVDAVWAVREAYAPFGRPTDTLVTKIILGTLGCLPACDRYFLVGFKSQGFSYSHLNALFIEQVLRFCSTNLAELRCEQERIESASGMRYPLMKLLDMYFWKLGHELGAGEASREEEVAL